jgi:hypothetical protein
VSVDRSSLTISPAALTKVTTLRNQRQSPLLRLPAELRNKVYAYVLGGREIELCGYQRCQICNQAPYRDAISHYPRNLLNLLHACRQCHSEARLLPFSSSTFIALPDEVNYIISRHFSHAQTHAIEAIGLQLYANIWNSYMLEHVPRQLHSILENSLKSLERMPRLNSLSILWVGSVPELEDQKRFKEKVLMVVEDEFKRTFTKKNVKIPLIRRDDTS